MNQWKIWSKKTHHLQSGKTFSLYHSRSYGVYDSEITDDEYIKGMSFTWLLVLRGCLDTQSGIAQPTQSGVSAAQINMVQTIRVKVAPVQPSMKRFHLQHRGLIISSLTNEVAAKPYLGIGTVPNPVALQTTYALELGEGSRGVPVFVENALPG